jgi:hypothetical protein
MNPETIHEIDSELARLSSVSRAEALFHYLCLFVHAPRFFWPVLNEWFCRCDDAWWARKAFLRLLLRQRSAAPEHLKAKDREFLETLPEFVTIYRGCSKERVLALSWTTDFEIARGFVRGHRNLAVPNPVVAKATVNKKHIFTAITERKESEVLVNYLMLRHKISYLPATSI